MPRARAGQIYFSIDARTQKFQEDIALANKHLDSWRLAGRAAGAAVTKSMAEASDGAHHFADAASVATAAALQYFGTTARGATNLDLLKESFRGLRFALSPTPFTAATIATGILIEETLKLVNARGKLIEQQSMLAATKGVAFGDIEKIGLSSGMSGANSSDMLAALASLRSGIGSSRVQSALSGLNIPDFAKGAATPALLGQIAERMSAITDPTERARLAVKLFGEELGEKVLPQLNQQFAASSVAVDSWGLTLSETSRNQVFAMRQDMLNLKDEVLSLGTGFQALGEKMKQALVVGAAKTYDAGKSSINAIGATLQGAQGEYAKAVYGKTDNTPYASLALKYLFGDSFGENDQIAKFAMETNRARGQAAGQSDVAKLLSGQASGIIGSRANTREGLESMLGAAQGRRSTAIEALEANTSGKHAGELTADQVRDYSRDVISATQQITFAEAAVKKLAEAEERLNKAKAERLAEPGKIAALNHAATMAGLLSPTEKAAKQTDFNMSQLPPGASDELRKATLTAGIASVSSALEAEKLNWARAQKEWAAGVVAQVKSEREKSATVAKEVQGILWQDATDKRKMVHDTAGRNIRMAGIQSDGDEAALADQILTIRLKALGVERAIVEERRSDEHYAEAIAQIDREAADARGDHEEQMATYRHRLQQEALGAGGGFQLRLKQLAKESEALNEIKVTDQNILDIENARKALEDERLQILTQQQLANGSLSAGWRAFFTDMQRRAKQPGQILYEGMESALDRISDNLTDLLTGKSTNWGAMMQDIGRQMVNSTIRSSLQGLLGALGRKSGPGSPGSRGSVTDALRGTFGGGSAGGMIFSLGGMPQGIGPNAAGGMGKPDGTPGNPFYVVMSQGGSQQPAAQAIQRKQGFWGPFLGSLVGAAIGGLAGGGGGGPQFSTDSSIIFDGARARGGPTRRGKSYLVGEEGPEIFTGGDGRILSHSESKKLMQPNSRGYDLTPRSISAASSRIAEGSVGMAGGGGDKHTYYVDARGSDERTIFRAIRAAHDSSVSTGVQATVERAKRTPQAGR
ncbi:MAG: hypothetical protein JWN34_2843 [Bryobacterales bacterium]|nr:hypothetical protein [Bryobacterales bacterium]